jgi:hypothetical protein
MHTLNHELEQSVLEADGRYLSAQELYSFEKYIQSYGARLHAYQQLRDNSDKLVIQALRKMAQTHPELIQQHGQRCKYDMSEVLRYIALSILRNDETFLKEQVTHWLDTILLAYKRHSHCVVAYRYLQDAISATFTNTDAEMVRPYLEIVIETLQSHA